DCSGYSLEPADSRTSGLANWPTVARPSPELRAAGSRSDLYGDQRCPFRRIALRPPAVARTATTAGSLLCPGPGVHPRSSPTASVIISHRIGGIGTWSQAMARKNAGSTRSPIPREIRSANPPLDFPEQDRHVGADPGQDPRDERPASSLYDVFISYAEADRAWVDGFLIDGLERAGVRCHREAAFALGVPRLAEFEQAVRSSARILLVLSPAYFSTDTASFVDLLAQTYGLETATWPVIPLRLEPVNLPTRLAMLTALDATDPDERERGLEALSQLVQRRPPAAPARPACPYPGMRAFTLDDGFPFFGRDRECEELLQHLRQSRFLTVIGGSGSGKSSLVFAGLVPKLRKTGLFGPGKWLVRAMRPGGRPLAEPAPALGADPGHPAAPRAAARPAGPEAKRPLPV